MEKKHGKKSVYTQEKYNLKKAVTGYFYAVWIKVKLTSDLIIIVFVYKFEKYHLDIDWCLL
jgi:hypothetical protein